MTPEDFWTARQQLGLSQSELAQALRLSTGKRAIRAYEDGTRPIGPTVELLMWYMLKYGLPHVALRNRKRAE